MRKGFTPSVALDLRQPVLRGAVSAFWRDVADVSEAIADAGRRFYTGNAQTYVLYAFLLVLALAGIGLAR